MNVFEIDYFYNLLSQSVRPLSLVLIVNINSYNCYIDYKIGMMILESVATLYPILKSLSVNF